MSNLIDRLDEAKEEKNKDEEARRAAESGLQGNGSASRTYSGAGESIYESPFSESLHHRVGKRRPRLQSRTEQRSGPEVQPQV